MKVGFGGPPHFPYTGEVVRIAGQEVMADCESGCEPGDGPCYWDDAPGELSCLRHIGERVALDRSPPVVLEEAALDG